jgi:small acid-soluble spore protein (thioredoxin-like protein)
MGILIFEICNKESFMRNSIQHNMSNSMKNKPDDRSDNVEKIQRNIDMTMKNMELADELIAKTSDGKLKKDLQGKNERRERALDGMRHEIRDEAINAKTQKNSQ